MLVRFRLLIQGARGGRVVLGPVGSSFIDSNGNYIDNVIFRIMY